MNTLKECSRSYIFLDRKTLDTGTNTKALNTCRCGKQYHPHSDQIRSDPSLSRVRLFTIAWTAAHRAPPSMEFSRQEYWSGLPLPSPLSVLETNNSRFFFFSSGPFSVFSLWSVLPSESVHDPFLPFRRNFCSMSTPLGFHPLPVY